jgi:endonuclease YncB( thermonuclease family)
LEKYSIVFIAMLVTVSSCVTPEPNTACTHDEKTFRCVKYLKNYDADTITFEIPGVHPIIGNKLSVRVAGVDTPELRTKDRCEKKAGLEAKHYVANLMKKAKSIELRNLKRGKYFRIVAEVYADGVSIGEKLLKSGRGYPYHGGTKKKINWCKSKK